MLDLSTIPNLSVFAGHSVTSVDGVDGRVKFYY